MAVPAWPNGLPGAVLREGWSVRPVSPLRRTEMDDGAVAVTRRVTRVRTILPVRWDMNGDQWALFRDFWLVDLDAGAAWFDAPLTLGTAYETLRVRFARTDPPWEVVSDAPGFFAVAAELEIAALPALGTQARLDLEALF